jgi:transcriptional regulator with XRE-family HTH domain
MALNQDNLEFSERLRQAISRLPNRVDTPAKLAIEFNLVHNEPVTNQAVWKWLSGQSKPSRDKIDTLARMCGVSVQWLRFGIPESRSAQASSASPATKQDARTRTEQQLLENFRLLTQVQQELLSGMAEQLAMNHRIWQSEQL